MRGLLLDEQILKSWAKTARENASTIFCGRSGVVATAQAPRSLPKIRVIGIPVFADPGRLAPKKAPVKYG